MYFSTDRVHPFSTYAKFSKKLNVCFSENFAYLINGWSYIINIRIKTVKTNHLYHLYFQPPEVFLKIHRKTPVREPLFSLRPATLFKKMLWHSEFCQILTPFYRTPSSDWFCILVNRKKSVVINPFQAIFHSAHPENNRKPEVFWYFQTV